MGSLPSIEFILDREEHWHQALEQAERAVAYARRQLQNCQQLKALIAGEVQMILLHGGEEG